MDDDVATAGEAAELEATVNWVKTALPPEYGDVLEGLFSLARDDETVTGLLVTGSVARRDAQPGTDIDIRLLCEPGRRREFARTVNRGVPVEISWSDEPAALAKMRSNPMHVYAYLDGRILYDRVGALARLRDEAERIMGEYLTPLDLKAELAETLSHPAEKLRTALAADDLYRAVYTASTSTWFLIEGLWGANDLPVPPNSSVRPHLGDLAGPHGVERDFERMLMGHPGERARTALALMDWARAQLQR